MTDLLSPIPPIWLVWPLLAQMGWTFLLYALLTLARVRAVKRGEATLSTYALSRDEPAGVARITRNLANQFELPTIWYVFCVLLIGFGQVTPLAVTAGWVFVAGRVVHSGVQILTDDVALRGRVFTINFVACIVIAASLAWSAFQRSFN